MFSDTVNTGIYVLEPEIFGYIPEEENFDFAILDKVVAEHGFRITDNQVDAEAADARANFTRLRSLGERNLVAVADVDRARAAAGNADGQVRAAQAGLDELLHGTRSERIAQGEAAAVAAQAQAAAASAGAGMHA